MIIHPRHRLLSFLSVCFLLVVCQACDKSETVPTDAYSYYPLELGTYQIYQVTETTYSASQTKPGITNYQEKDEVARILSNAENQEVYIIARYRRAASTDYWQKNKEYTVTRSPDRILSNIDNETVVSLLFPTNAKMEWNGNALNGREARNYYYENINLPAKMGELSFDKTLTVVERRDSTILNKNYGVKKYASGIGLISDDQINYEYCQDEDCIGSGKIESGTHRQKTIIEFGPK
jgi:hypothetical protein